MTKKYPIGTKIRFLWKVDDTGKFGTIVGFHRGGDPVIFLPTSENVRQGYFNGSKFTWKCKWHEIEPIGQQQLLFDFMYK